MNSLGLGVVTSGRIQRPLFSLNWEFMVDFTVVFLTADRLCLLISEEADDSLHIFTGHIGNFFVLVRFRLTIFYA